MRNLKNKKTLRVVKILSVILELWGIWNGFWWFYSEVGALGPVAIQEPADRVYPIAYIAGGVLLFTVCILHAIEIFTKHNVKFFMTICCSALVYNQVIDHILLIAILDDEIPRTIKAIVTVAVMLLLVYFKDKILEN